LIAERDTNFGDQLSHGPVELPLVSIIITAYNYEAFVSLAVQSAIDQSYPSVEVIVVDDGSTDGTFDEVRKFGSAVRYFIKENGGLAKARNYGIDKSRGDFLLFLDADDELEPGAVQVMHNCMCRLSDDYAIVACTFTKIDSEGNVMGSQGNLPREEGDITCRQLLMRNRFPVTALTKRSAIVQCGMFDPGYGTSLGSEDRDIWVRVSSLHKVRMLTDPLLRKRVHGANMSSKADNQHRGMIRTIGKARVSNAVPGAGFMFWAKVASVRRFQFAMMRRGCRDRAGGWLELLRSCCAWPWFFSLDEVGLPAFFRVRCALRWILGRSNFKD